MIAVALLALVVALVSLGLALRPALVAGSPRRSAGRGGDPGAGLPPDVAALRGEVAALRTEAGQALRHVAVVRYDAFAPSASDPSAATSAQGGQLSWSLALLDDAGSGVVLTSIHGRSDARTYAKSVAGWRSAQTLSPEEEQAITSARSG